MMKKYLKLYVAVLVVSLVSIFEIQLSKTAVYEEESLDSGIKVLAQMQDLRESYANASVDSSLGTPFRRYAMHTMPVYGKEFHSTLIEYPYGSSKRTDSLAAKPAHGIILYVHGYNDYFFQRELAEKADSAGYAFFAIDLHYCGRSFMPGDARGDMRNMREFFAELDYAVELARVITKERADSLPMVLMGHSQGGLLAAFYADHRPEEKFAALVLNSPFFDFNFNWLVRNLAIPVVSEIAILLPDFSIGSSGNPNYAYSLDKKYYGEWLYNTEWKSESRPEQFLGWVRAIHKAQQELHRGFHINSPTLVMHGDCTEKSEEWSENYMHCDGVLDVEHIEKWAPKVGPNVKTETVAGGLHDLFLSRKAVRDEAYAKAFRFIDESL
ncbi:Lysophospholipase, alpha-beta hydrolase superfamily [Fibrobacter sp. UWR3]|uniref:alpha/beta hydrolase n=1 Tax=Fibrobacter sp. UWR3 TaxID=1896217 RepID=UPI00091F7732|nr:alpha/beta hydrolase [Fibrobacter sp. UWR3]SHN10311.1 Lysophospholipase, alpha-beta hydrolase superfamily [Fibrobacter sp. UWR3]